VLDEKVLECAAASDEDIVAQVVDYSQDYPQGVSRSLAQVTYAQLKSGSITVQGKEVPTGALSSYSRAKEIAEELKSWISQGTFTLTVPVAALPGAESGYTCRPLRERPL